MRGGRKSERLRERVIDREREDRSGWRWRQPKQVGLGVEWNGLVVGGSQIGNRWWQPDRLMRWRARWSTACGRLSRSELNLYSSMHGWRSERWVLGVYGSVMREGWGRPLLDRRWEARPRRRCRRSQVQVTGLSLSLTMGDFLSLSDGDRPLSLSLLVRFLFLFGNGLMVRLEMGFGSWGNTI